MITRLAPPPCYFCYFHNEIIKQAIELKYKNIKKVIKLCFLTSQNMRYHPFLKFIVLTNLTVFTF